MAAIKSMTHRTYRRWTPDEDSLLGEFAGQVSLVELARRLNRHYTVVYERAKRLGLSTRWRRFGFRRRDTIMATVHPSTSDLYWAAGFLEGEGSFCRYPNRKGRGDGSNRVSASQKKRECLDRLSRLFGGRVNCMEQRGCTIKGTPYGPIHHWQVNGAIARGVMMTLFCLLSVWRQAQIKEALRREPRNAF